MLVALQSLYRKRTAEFKGRLVVIGLVLAALNLTAWIWALCAFWATPSLLATALLVYGLGLRHAVDADHIAAIDNVTRKLIQMGQRPVAVGFFFAMGHSTVVALAGVLVAAAAISLSDISNAQTLTGIIGTGVSALFLFIIAAMNIGIFASVYRDYRRLRAGHSGAAVDQSGSWNHGGYLARLLRPLFRLVTRSWHMYPLGFCFGLGFDTATEVALFGISAAQAYQGLHVASLMVFPLLFAAGMSLVDTADGVMMLGIYRWALLNPLRKLYYNLSITAVSIVVALIIGGLELCSLLSEQLKLTGGGWRAARALGEHFNGLGLAIIGLCILSWALSFAISKTRQADSAQVIPK